MKKGSTLQRIIALALAALCLMSFCACSANDRAVKGLISDFEGSCNRLDLNAMLDCINPSVAEGVKLATGIAGIFTDKNTDEILDSLASFVLNEAPEDAKEFFSSIRITVNDVYTQESSATAYASISYKISGEEYKKSAEFECVQDGEKWYISDFDLK